MKPESYEKLTRLKQIIGQMSISDKVAFVAAVSSRLTPDMLKTSDGQYTFSEENLLSVALGALISDTTNEFEAITGFYGGGYQSALRKGLYHGKGDISDSQWRKEIRRLYHKIKQNIGDMTLPPLREFQESIPQALMAGNAAVV
jgi:hypothetical protein